MISNILKLEINDDEEFEDDMNGHKLMVIKWSLLAFLIIHMFHFEFYWICDVLVCLFVIFFPYIHCRLKNKIIVIIISIFFVISLLLYYTFIINDYFNYLMLCNLFIYYIKMFNDTLGIISCSICHQNFHI